MGGSAVPGFLPSRNGFRFANRWPSGPAREWHVGLVHLGIGDVGRGLCGGMAFVAADRFVRGIPAPTETEPPAPESPLFREVVDAQFDSFGPLFVVPVRFALAAVEGRRRRRRHSVRDAWPRIRADIDAGRLSMVGLVRRDGFALVAPDFGHQVVAYRYEASPERVAIGVYDPNHPGDDTVEIVLERAPDGTIRLGQSTGEPLLGLLALPWRRAAPATAPPSTEAGPAAPVSAERGREATTG
jgi:hypothetical protein